MSDVSFQLGNITKDTITLMFVKLQHRYEGYLEYSSATLELLVYEFQYTLFSARLCFMTTRWKLNESKLHICLLIDRFIYLFIDNWFIHFFVGRLIISSIIYSEAVLH